MRVTLPMLLRLRYLMWRPRRIAEVTPDTLVLLELLQPAPEVLVLGTGAQGCAAARRADPARAAASRCMLRRVESPTRMPHGLPNQPG
jgi:hypothetical protein